MQKLGIIIATFGSTVEKARQSYIDFYHKVKNRYPDSEIRMAFTSTIVRKILSSKGIKTESVSESLDILTHSGYKNIVIQSLHIIPGEEYHKIINEISSLKNNCNFCLRIGKPLLSNYDDMLRTANSLLNNIPEDRKNDEAVIFMGHGSRKHASDLIYLAFAAVLRSLDEYAILGTVEGHPQLDDVINECRKKQIKKAWIFPFMTIAGDHAVNDMAGEEPDSWKSVLNNMGIDVKTKLSGLLDDISISSIWLDHLDAEVKSFAVLTSN